MSNLNNNTPATATLLPLTAGIPATATGSLSSLAGGDLLDYYQFSTTAASNLKLSLSGLSGNARLSVFAKNPNGSLGAAVVPTPAGNGNTSNTSNSGLLSESFVFNDLSAGSYFVRVDLDMGATAADYRLDAIANRDVTANTILWQKTNVGPNDPLLVSWQLNGPSVAATASSSQSQSPQLAGYQFVGTGDFDGDKIQDVLWKKSLGNGTYQLYTWFMNADNSLRESKPVVFAGQTNAIAISDSFQIQRIEDFGGDGKADILFREVSTNSIVLWQMDGNTLRFDRAKNYTQFDPAFEVFATGDFDSNGKRDILFRNPTGGEVVVWLLNENLDLIFPAGPTNNPGESGLLKFNGVPVNLTAEWEVLGVADFNSTADTRDDVMFANRNTGALVAWLINGSAIQDGGFLLNAAPVSTFFDLVGIGDLNGDGNGDLLWNSKDPNGGPLVAWLMNGKDINFATSGIVQVNGADFSLPSTFEVVGFKNVSPDRRLLDFDGNGRADAFLRDKVGGSTILWSMNGRTVQSSDYVKLSNGSIPAVPSEFQVIGSLSAQLVKQPQSTAGSVATTAFNIGVLEGTGNYQDVVAGTTPDFFKFKLDRLSDVTVALSDGFGTSGAVSATFALSRQTGLNADGTPLLTPVTLGSDPLDAGTYFIQVTRSAGGTTPVNYYLNVTGSPVIFNLRGSAFTSVTPDAGFVGTGGAVRLPDIPLGTAPGAGPKATVDIDYTIENTDPGKTGPVTVRFYLSRTPTITPGSSNTIVLGTDTITGGVPGNSSVSKVFANVALPPGDDNFWTTDTNYYIGYEIDPVSPAAPEGALLETNETDNINLGLNIDVKTVAIQNTQTPDLLGNTLSATGTQITKGGQITLDYSVRNAGRKATGSIATPPPDVFVRFYLYRGSPNTLNPSDDTRTIALTVANGTLFLPENINGESNSPVQSVTLNLPNDQASFWQNDPLETQYYIGMEVDAGNSITESDELNNLNVGLGQDSVLVTLV
jgi:hypothetical protein